MNKPLSSPLKTRLRKLIASFLITIILLPCLMLAQPVNQVQAHAVPLMQKIVAYNIDRNIDLRRKEETKQKHGSDVEKIVEEAQENNENQNEEKELLDEKITKKAQKVIQHVQGQEPDEKENNS